MPKFEELIVAWRKEMTAAGIGPGPVRDELESHLREAIDEMTRSGMSESDAFAAAVKRLGAAAEIRCECDAALSIQARLRRLLRCEFFPTNLNLCAWTALPLAPLFFARGFAHIPGGAISSLIGLVMSIAGVAGLLGACLWLGRKSLAGAWMLAFFWSLALWFFLFGFFIVSVLARLSETLASVVLSGGSFLMLLTLPGAIVAAIMWWRQLLRKPDRSMKTA